MVDGKSDELETLKGYRDSEIKDLLEASRKRISSSVENVTADEKKEEGEATIVFTYFDVDDVTKTVDEDSSIRDAKKAIEDAKEIELEYDVELTLEKDWMIMLPTEKAAFWIAAGRPSFKISWRMFLSILRWRKSIFAP